ncbi:MAG: hypothetical protein ACLQU2_07280 [Candidatus Binataceae bacterium]
MNHLHAEYRMAVGAGAPDEVAAECFYRYRLAVNESRRRHAETNRLIEMARVFIVGLSLNFK